MMFARAFGLMAGWTALYYLAGVFITSEWNVSEWDSAAKFVSLVLVWFPVIVVILIAYAEVRKEEKWNR